MQLTGIFEKLCYWHEMRYLYGVNHDLRPVLACCKTKAICWSVNRDRLIENILLAGFGHLSKILSS
jgi:hypothetical protein